MEYHDGIIEILPTNIIAESILTQVDDKCHTELSFEEIIDHKKTDEVIKNEEACMVDPENRTKKRK